jgi:hypothetical protein
MDFVGKLSYLGNELVEASTVEEDVFHEYWKVLEYFLREAWKSYDWDLNRLEMFTKGISKVIEVLPIAFYKNKIPVFPRLLWFCDDFARLDYSNDLKKSVSSFHTKLLQLRKQKVPVEVIQKPSEDEYQFDESVINKLNQDYKSVSLDSAFEDSWVKGQESELENKIETYLKTCKKEEDFDKLGVYLWKYLQFNYFEKAPLKQSLKPWLKGARSVIFQTSSHDLLYRMLGFFPVVLENQFSVLTFRISDLTFVREIRNWLVELLDTLQLDSNHAERMQNVVHEYWKFFFYFLRREKFGAFDLFVEPFLGLMDAAWKAKPNYSYAGEVSEVYYSLVSSNRERYKESVLKALKSVCSKGSQCFKELFPENNEPKGQLTEETLLTEVLREVWRDGTVDDNERQVLMKLFRFLKIDKEYARKKMKEVEEEVRKEGFKEGALSGKHLIRTLMRLAWQDGDVGADERKILNAIGTILGLSKPMMVDLFYEAKQGVDTSDDQPVMIPAVEFNDEFERNLNEVKEESFHLDSLNRDLTSLLEKDLLNLQGDKIDWADLFPVPCQVEIETMPDSEKVGMFIFVDRRGILILREILQALSYIVVKPGEEESAIYLHLWDGRVISVNQSDGFTYDDKFKEALSKYKGHIQLMIVDHSNKEIVSSFEYGCSVSLYDMWKDFSEAVAEENFLKIKMLHKRVNRDYPYDRVYRNFYMKGLLDSGECVNVLNDLDRMSKEVFANDRGDFEFYYLYAKALQKSGRKADAVQALKRSLRINRQYLPALLAICTELKETLGDEFYFYAKFLKVYHWRKPESQAFIKSLKEELGDEDYQDVWTRLCQTPLTLWSSRRFSGTLIT